MRTLGLMIAVFACGSLFADETPLQTETREWKSADGNFTTTAKLTGFTADGLLLLKDDGKTSTVAIGKLSADDRAYACGVYRTWDGRPSLGIAFGDYVAFRANLVDSEQYKKDKDYRAAVKTYPTQPGLIASDVLDGSPAERAGVQKLDLVTHVNGRPVKDDNSLYEALMATRGETIELRGREFSAGDAAIADTSDRTLGPGNATQWVAWCVNHHIEHTAQQIADVASA